MGLTFTRLCVIDSHTPNFNFLTIFRTYSHGSNFQLPPKINSACHIPFCNRKQPGTSRPISRFNNWGARELSALYEQTGNHPDRMLPVDLRRRRQRRQTETAIFVLLPIEMNYRIRSGWWQRFGPCLPGPFGRSVVSLGLSDSTSARLTTSQ